MAVDAVSSAIDALRKACKSIDDRAGRKLTAILAADRKAIHAALKVVPADMPLIVMAGSKGGTPAPNVPSPPADISTPTVPFVLDAVSGDGEVTFRFVQSCDKGDGTTAGSGVSTYPWSKGGVAQTPIAAPTTNILGDPTTTNIGSASPAPSYTRQGVDFDLVTGGETGVENTTDQIGITHWAYTAVPAIHATVTELTSPDSATFPGDYGGAGVMLRESTAAGSKFICAYYVTGSIRYIYCKWRSATNGAVSQAYAVGTGSIGQLLILPNGSGSYSIYSMIAGSDPVLVKTLTSSDISLSATGVAGCFGFSLTTNAVTAKFRNIGVVPYTLMTQLVTTASAETFAVSAVDADANASAVSRTITGSPISAASAVAWNPGHYIRPIPSGQGYWFYSIRHSEVMTKLKSYFADIAAVDGITGVLFGFSWRDVETSEGVYDFTVLDDAIDEAKSYGLRYAIVLTTASQFISNDIFPDYMFTDTTTKRQYFSMREPSTLYDGNYRYWATTGSARTKLASLLTAIGQHVNSDPKCEFVNILGAETSFNAYVYDSASWDSEYDATNVLDGFTDACEAWHAAAPNKMGAQYFNSFVPDTLEQAQGFYAVCEANFIMYQNPNSVHEDGRDVSMFALPGIDYDGDLPGGGSSFIDYSTRIPVCAPGDDDNDYWSDTHGPALGTPYQSLAQQWADKSGVKTITNPLTGGSWNLSNPYYLPFLNCSHYVWLLNDDRGGDSTNQWDGDEPAFIEAKILVTPSVDAPSCFDSVGVVTGG